MWGCGIYSIWEARTPYGGVFFFQSLCTYTDVQLRKNAAVRRLSGGRSDRATARDGGRICCVFKLWIWNLEGTLRNGPKSFRKLVENDPKRSEMFRNAPKLLETLRTALRHSETPQNTLNRSELIQSAPECSEMLQSPLDIFLSIWLQKSFNFFRSLICQTSNGRLPPKIWVPWP